MDTFKKELRIAIVHDWLVGGGAEQVVLQLHKLFPDAPIYTSYCTKEWRKRLDGKVVTGYLQYLGKLRKFLPLLRQHWFASLNLKKFDLVISSSGNGEAKFVKITPPAIQICYCHSPTHFYWRHHAYYKKTPGFGLTFVVQLALTLFADRLRLRDYRAARQVNYFIANSTHTQKDIKKFYGKDAVIIHPPVDTTRFDNDQRIKQKYYVTVGRQVPYKKIDLLIGACNILKLPLKVIGNGPEHNKLVKTAGPTIEFLNNLSDEQVATQVAGAQAFLFAAYEDFGVSAVEALAAGTPVVAFGGGGALDYVIPGKTGELFEKQTVDSLAKVLKSFDSAKYKPNDLKEEAAKYSIQAFRSSIVEFIERYT